jgi:hypothetical protein
VLVVLLGPANEDRAVAVQPGVSGLDDPAPGAPGSVADLRRQLLAAGADVRLEALRNRQLADVVVVVAASQAQALRRGVGGAIGVDASVASSSFMSWRLAPSCASPIGTPAASVRTERFAPLWLYRWDSARSRRPRAAPWSSRHRRPETTSRCRPARRTPTAPATKAELLRTIWGFRSMGSPRPQNVVTEEPA